MESDWLDTVLEVGLEVTHDTRLTVSKARMEGKVTKSKGKPGPTQSWEVFWEDGKRKWYSRTSLRSCTLPTWLRPPKL